MAKIYIYSDCKTIINPPTLKKVFHYTFVNNLEDIIFSGDIIRGNRRFRKLKLLSVEDDMEHSKYITEITLKMTPVNYYGDVYANFVSNTVVINNPSEEFELEVTGSNNWLVEVIGYKTTSDINSIDEIIFEEIVLRQHIIAY